jgi:hypothetical protein
MLYIKVIHHQHLGFGLFYAIFHQLPCYYYYRMISSWSQKIYQLLGLKTIVIGAGQRLKKQPTGTLLSPRYIFSALDNFFVVVTKYTNLVS